MTTATLEGFANDVTASASLAPRGVGDFGAREDRLRARLDRLAQLNAGWDGEDAKPIDELALRLATALAQQLLRGALPEPEVFPVPDGGVQLECHAGPVELELQVEPGLGRWFSFGDDEQSRQQIDGLLPRDESRFGLALARLNA